jgi:cell wall assembly regulator SMI1
VSPDPAGVADACHAWLGVLTAAGFDPALRAPAEPQEVAAAEERIGRAFPVELRALYALADGQDDTFPRRDTPRGCVADLFPCHRFLPVAEALAEWGSWREVADAEGPAGMADHAGFVTVRGDDPVLGEYWVPGWWPLARDGGGNALAVDLTPAPGGTAGQVVVMGPDEDERRVLAPGIAAYLRLLPGATTLGADGGGPVWDAPDLR